MENIKFRLCHFLKCKIIGFENMKPRFFFYRTFTQYHIKTKELFSRKSVIVQKRYSEFNAFKKKLLKMQVKIPQFPKKQFKGRFEPNFIKNRLKRFQEILSYLFRMDLNKNKTQINLNQKFQIIDTILEFLQIPQETINYIKTAFTSPLNKDIAQVVDDNFVFNFLNKIQYEPEFKSNTLREAANLFFSQKILLKVKSIETLLRGMDFQQQNFYMKGLIQLCGYNESRSVNQDALIFILKLIDSEYTQNFHQYLNVLVTTESTILREIEIEKHILNSKWSRQHALQILKQYPLEFEEKLLEIVKYQQIMDILLKEFTQIKGYTGEHEQEPLNHVTIQGIQGNEQATNKQMDFSEQKIECQQIQEWKIIKHPNNITFAHKFRNDNQAILQFKMKFILDGCTPRIVAEHLTNYKNRTLWDVKFIKGQILEFINKRNVIVNETFANYNNGYQDQSIRNFVLKRKIEIVSILIQANDNSVIINYKPTKYFIDSHKFLLPAGIQQAQIYKMKYVISEYETKSQNLFKVQKTFNNLIDTQIQQNQSKDFLDQSPEICNENKIWQNYSLLNPKDFKRSLKQKIRKTVLKQKNVKDDNWHTYHFNRSKILEDSQRSVMVKYKCDLDTRAADLFRGDILQENEDLIQTINNLQKLISYGVEAYKEDQKSERIYKLKSHNSFLQAVQRKNGVRQFKMLESSCSANDIQKYDFTSN